jgi:hypothetical protein
MSMGGWNGRSSCVGGGGEGHGQSHPGSSTYVDSGYGARSPARRGVAADRRGNRSPYAESNPIPIMIHRQRWLIRRG